jgi:hypothetical protein
VTTFAPETLVGQEADLLFRLKAVLNGHPAGGSFHLLLAATGITVADDEILVQEIDTARGIVELRPRKLNDVTLGEVLHPTQVISPADVEFTQYTASPQATDYYPTTPPDGSAGHLLG